MQLRRSPIREIAKQLARCRDAGIPMNPQFLEAHALAGGDIEDLVDGLQFAAENNMTGEAEPIAARQMMSTTGGPTLREQLAELVAAGIHDASHGLALPDTDKLSQADAANPHNPSVHYPAGQDACRQAGADPGSDRGVSDAR